MATAALALRCCTNGDEDGVEKTNVVSDFRMNHVEELMAWTTPFTPDE